LPNYLQFLFTNRTISANAKLTTDCLYSSMSCNYNTDFVFIFYSLVSNHLARSITYWRSSCKANLEFPFWWIDGKKQVLFWREDDVLLLIEF